MPLISESWPDDTNAEVTGGKGCVRMIRSYVGSITKELVRYKKFPLLCYSCVDEVLGHSDHLGVIICLPQGNKDTKIVWRTYAHQTSNVIEKFLGGNVFRYVVEESLAKLAKKWPIEPRKR
eukprot:TRINITY_DN9015_c0_g1_i1.p1 TRINITY_DN9015_c0_g1~~TRINITY_DN9015_c0_g1_i1.p1  ORF type:complete len:121 (+),score=15.77 TRINITY_DN9015_c0_g1_i1:234-596(+)